MTQTVDPESNNESIPMTVEAVVMLMKDDYTPDRVLPRSLGSCRMTYNTSELEITMAAPSMPSMLWPPTTAWIASTSANRQ